MISNINMFKIAQLLQNKNHKVIKQHKIQTANLNTELFEFVFLSLL